MRRCAEEYELKATKGRIDRELVNRLHAEVPATTRIAFNTNPADSDTAALRFV